jgi:hypothetical protein
MMRSLGPLCARYVAMYFCRSFTCVSSVLTRALAFASSLARELRPDFCSSCDQKKASQVVISGTGAVRSCCVFHLDFSDYG